MDNLYELVYDPETTDGVFGISLVKDPAIQIEALRFSKEEIPSNVIDNLIKKGEKEPNGDWVCIDTQNVSDLIQFADIDSEADLFSEQDNAFFRIRYKYSPESVNLRSREFCRKMVQANKVYRKEDIDEASQSGVNGQFAMSGTSSYDIWLFKGGANCKHRWVRKIYFNKSNKQLSYAEALAKIAKLPKAVQNAVVVPSNDPRVGQVASSSNNYWRMSSEEKRVLVSPVLIPNQKIYRGSVGKTGKPGFVFVTEETIEQLQQNFFRQNHNHNSSIEHLYPITDGVFIFESWIIEDPLNDKAKALGYDLPKGTWMVSMKIDNDTIWNSFVKTGKIGGLSMDATLISEKVNNENLKFNQEMKKETFNAKLKKALVKRIAFNSDVLEFITKDGVSVFATELVEGSIVTDVDGNIMPEAVLEIEGRIYETDTEGVIISVKEVEVEVDTIELSDEMLEEALEEVKEEIVNEYEVAMAELTKEVEELRAENAELKLKIADAEVKVEEVVELSKHRPASKGVKVAFRKDNVPAKGILGAIRK